MVNQTVSEQKARYRSHLANAPLSEKLEALIQMQRIARSMALAAGRPFEGVVWGEASPKITRLSTAPRCEKYGSSGSNGSSEL